MTRETTFGLLLVVVLTGVFGFMVYKKMHQPAGLAADTSDVDGAPGSGDAAHPDAAAAQALLTVPGENPQAGDILDTSSQQEGTVLLAAAETKPASSAQKPAAAKAPWATEDDPFAEPAATTARPAAKAPAKPASVVEFEDPFAAETTPSAKPSTSQTRAAASAPAAEDLFAAPPHKAAVQATTPLDDPFASQPPTGSKATPVPQVESDPFAGGAADVQPALSAKPAPALSIQPSLAPRAAPANSDVFEAATISEPLSQPDRRAAPQFATESTVPELRNEASATSTTVIERASAMPVDLDLPEEAQPPFDADATIHGTAYVVQPQDNYWEISKKLYGAGRYAQALAKHNEAAIPDPQRMKPGTPIATPSAEELEARYAALIPDLGAAPTAGAADVALSGDMYVAVVGDNFWTISKKVYGNGRYFQALAEYNRDAIPDPLKLREGTPVQTPPVDLLQARVAEPAAPPTRTAALTADIAVAPAATDGERSGFFLTEGEQPAYRIAAEDTLTGIARAHLGRASRWRQILEMNRDVLKDGNSLAIGTVLRLPADASQVQAVGVQPAGR